ncbi:hypothetical protein G7Y89_g10004 [Cudoniella acicularis]|uniref:Uncharacterized protein n=1 Tax=Cudoniella acicularis TaxID=354080 RepID=A0A8H4VZH0_9HELO|nr:hypothetical protein G7Y89_g10004 [Cudoniella acicularis]
MFSYLRPHHRRTSTPSSPAEQSHSFEPPLHPIEHGHGHPQRWQDSGSPEPTSATSPPYISSNMTRVASGGSDTVPNEPSRSANEWEPRTQNWDSSKGNARSQNIFSYSNHQRIPYAASQRPDSAGNAGVPNHTSFQTSRPQAGGTHDVAFRQKSPEPRHTFVTAVDLQNNSVATGKRPSGAKLPNPPPPSANTAPTFEPVQPKSGKARLNLLNPMSLLARRRTSHAIPQLSPEALAANRASENISENLDFRIRGTVVHDFSAPRPRRNVSYNDVRSEEVANNATKSYQRSPNPQYGESNTTEDSSSGPWSGGNHTPVFTENFEEEQYPAAGPHVRKANDLTDLPLPKPPYAKGAQRPVESNSTPKNNESIQKQVPAKRQISARKPVSDIGPPVPPKSNAPMPSEAKRISIDPTSAQPKSTLSGKKGRPRNVSEVSAKDAVIPKHMKSTSSRFSFDMIGAAEQERLLEDRHRQRALEKKAEKITGDEPEDDFEDEFDFDNYDDDDGLEERIPGVNADLDEEEEPDEFPQNGESLAGFTFQQSWLTPLSPSSPGMVSTPRDANGDVIGFAMTKNSPYVPGGLAQDSVASPLSPISPVSPASAESAVGNGTIRGLGLEGIGVPQAQVAGEQPEEQNVEQKDFPQSFGIDDDDLYFDDGIISGLGEADDTVEFDESVFDIIDTDQYGRPLKSLSSIPTLYSPPTLTSDPSPSLNKTVDSTDGAKCAADAISPTSLPLSGGLAPMPSILENRTSKPSDEPPATVGLTQDSLAAYQSALAAAAFTAAANGKFRRDSTPLDTTPSEHDDAQHDDTQPGLVSDSSHTSHYEPFSPNYDMEDDFDYDDALEDDAIIAVANAEALANDCDGFYGQEFGFYSAPAGEAEYANGGYFGPRGVEGVNRSQSGRVVSREPNLTPITERSEYSNRNSFMSPLFGPGSLASPGLAQLAGMMSSQEYEAGDMSLNALLKLRRGAWGGSQASLHSSAGSPKSAGGLDDGSPIGPNPPWASNNMLGNTIASAGHRRKNSAFSLLSESPSGTGQQSEGNSPPGSPTLTMSVPQDPVKKDSEQEKEANDREKYFKKHKYTGSAESISYSKEEDPVVGERWILERRRTAESGECDEQRPVCGRCEMQPHACVYAVKEVPRWKNNVSTFNVTTVAKTKILPKDTNPHIASIQPGYYGIDINTIWDLHAKAPDYTLARPISFVPEKECRKLGPKDTFLLVNFTSNTSRDLVGPQSLWSGDLTQLAFQHNYLLHAMLMLSARAPAKKSPQPKAPTTRPTTSHTSKRTTFKNPSNFPPHLSPQ